MRKHWKIVWIGDRSLITGRVLKIEHRQISQVFSDKTDFHEELFSHIWVTVIIYTRQRYVCVTP